MSKPLLLGFNTFKIEKKLLMEQKVARGDYKGEGILVMKGILQRADTLNQNGRVYPLHVLERELRNYQKLIKERRALGALDHTDSSIIELDTVSHVITDARMENGIVYGTVEILPTPKGDILRSLVESNITVGISSRGVGSTKPDADGYQVVQEDFQLICWDFVSEPSTPGAFMMREGVEISDKELRSFFNHSDRIDRILNDILTWENE